MRVRSVPRSLKSARRVSDDEWELVRSPLYATEVAAGDMIRVLDRDKGTFVIISRGGNVCVQFYLGPRDADDAQTTTMVAESIAFELESLGGTMDAKTSGLIAFTIPVDVGFPAIEKVFAAAADRHPGAQWQYSNVYDPTTGAPLGWWE